MEPPTERIDWRSNGSSGSNDFSGLSEGHDSRKEKSRQSRVRRQRGKSAASLAICGELADVTARLKGEQDAARALANEARELRGERDEQETLANDLKGQVAGIFEHHNEIVRNRFEAMDFSVTQHLPGMWATLRRLVKLIRVPSVMLVRLADKYFASGLYLPRGLGMLALELTNRIRAMNSLASGIGKRKYQVKFLKWTDHQHGDERPDNNCGLDLWHDSPRYAELLLTTSDGGNRFSLFEKTRRLTVSTEIFTQLSCPKNLNQTSEPAVAWMRINTDADRISRVNFDRNLVASREFVVQDAATLAYLHYLALRKHTRHFQRYFPSAPQSL